MLDEKALRKPGWSEGEWVTLCDGKAWCFPRIILDLGPEIGEDGSVDLGKPRPSLDDAYDRLLDAYIASNNALEEARALMRIAVHLLGFNYDLTPGDYRVLLRRRIGDQANLEIWRAIAEVAIGNDAPKPTAAGSAAS
jgi:hypothetical protein